MEPTDIIWRLLERIDSCTQTFDESYQELDPKKHSDLLRAIEECERLAHTQRNILNRMRRRYP